MRSTGAAAIAISIDILALSGLGLLGTTAAVAQDNIAEQFPPRSAPHHPPARIRVHPLARSYPGPDAVRQCTSWLETEYRPSGTVIVPRIHCWWARG
jgi:hypothetical protein